MTAKNILAATLVAYQNQMGGAPFITMAAVIQTEAPSIIAVVKIR